MNEKSHILVLFFVWHRSCCRSCSRCGPSIRLTDYAEGTLEDQGPDCQPSEGGRDRIRGATRSCWPIHLSSEPSCSSRNRSSPKVNVEIERTCPMATTIWPSRRPDGLYVGHPGDQFEPTVRYGHPACSLLAASSSRPRPGSLEERFPGTRRTPTPSGTRGRSLKNYGAGQYWKQPRRYSHPFRDRRSSPCWLSLAGSGTPKLERADRRIEASAVSPSCGAVAALALDTIVEPRLGE